jgi:hypothetical protein
MLETERNSDQGFFNDFSNSGVLCAIWPARARLPDRGPVRVGFTQYCSSFLLFFLLSDLENCRKF